MSTFIRFSIVKYLSLLVLVSSSVYSSLSPNLFLGRLFFVEASLFSHRCFFPVYSLLLHLSLFQRYFTSSLMPRRRLINHCFYFFFLRVFQPDAPHIIINAFNIFIQSLLNFVTLFACLFVSSSRSFIVGVIF